MSHVPVRGCRDVLGALAAQRRALVNAFGAHCATRAYQEIETPVLEPAHIYAASLGETSDVVAAEMFYAAACAPPVALRPEGTAGVARALGAAGLLRPHLARPTRVWYAGPMFRRERPQRLRWRQFMQLGAECVGEQGAEADAEVIEMAAGFLEGVGKRACLKVNTLGSKADREGYNEALRGFLEGKYAGLSEVSRERFDKGNCMRILDSKLDEDVEAVREAPRVSEFVSAEERGRFGEVLALLDEAGVECAVDDRLVRGLDYYTSTAFEFEGEGGRAVCAGGRYAGVGDASGVGFAIGLERIEEEALAEKMGADAYEKHLEGGVAVVGHAKGAAESGSKVGRACRQLARELRIRGVKASVKVDGGKLAKVVPRAIRSGAAVVVVIGTREVEAGCAQVRVVLGEGEEGPSGGREGAVEEVGLANVARVVMQKLRASIGAEGGREFTRLNVVQK